MSDDKSQGQGEDQKNQGDDGQDEQEEQQDVIEMSKEKLSDKIIEGRNEGIEKGKKDALGTINESLGTEFSSLDEATETLTSKSMDESDSEENEVVQELQDKLKEKDQKIENLSSKMQDIRTQDKLEKSVSDELGDVDLKLPFDEARTLVDSKFGYTEKDGTLYATKDGDRFLNDSGGYKTYAQAFKEYVKSRGLIDGGSSGGTGGGTAPSSKGGGSNNPFVTGNVTEQARLYNEDKAKYRRLKKEAGK